MSAPLALVAGGSRGLGLAVARRLVEVGHQVVLCARDADELDAAADDLRARGGQVHTFVTDVSDHRAVGAMVAQIESDLGPIEVTFCVAGVIQVGPLAALDRSHFTQAIDIMLWGPINVALAVLPAMRERGHGRIGVVTSIGGLIAAPHLLPYSTAKFGATGFARGLRSELVGSGVTVTAITPGLMRTGSHPRALFVGDQPREYAWFAAGASLPVLSMDADRAAEVMVVRTLQGRSTVLLTPLAQVAARVAGLAPSLTAAVLALTTRLLPSAPPESSQGTSTGTSASSGTVEGRTARAGLRPRSRAILNRLTVLGDRASRHFLQ